MLPISSKKFCFSKNIVLKHSFLLKIFNDKYFIEEKLLKIHEMKTVLPNLTKNSDKNVTTLIFRNFF